MPNSIETGIDIYGDSFIAARQNIEYWDLLGKDILIEDTSAMSAQYFKIIQAPTQFEGGKNAIFLLGDDNFLERETEILIEVLDSNGDNVFVEVTEYGIDRLWSSLDNNTILDAKGGKRCIAVWVQEDAAPGIGKLIVAGVAARTPDGSLIQNHPDPDVAKYYGEINIRWSKDIVIEPFRPNSSELIFLDYDRTKFSNLADSNALSGSVYEATYSYNYITSDNLENMDTHIYYSMSAMYSTYHSAIESLNGGINPLEGERIPGWFEYYNGVSNRNQIKIGVQTGSGRQQGYTEPSPVHVFGQANDAATHNISQSLPTPFATSTNAGPGSPYINGAGINVQVQNPQALADVGNESAYGFSIDGKTMWRLMASHSFWAPNETGSIGDSVYYTLYTSGEYGYSDYLEGGDTTSGNYSNFPGDGNIPNFPNGVYDFGNIPTSDVTSSAQIDDGWADAIKPSFYAAISNLEPDSGGDGPNGWVENGVDNDGNNVGAGVYIIGNTQGEAFWDMGSFGYYNSGDMGGAIYAVGMFHEFFGTNMFGKSSAPIWTRFSQSRANTNFDTEFSKAGLEDDMTSMSGAPPTYTPADGASIMSRHLDPQSGFKLWRIGQQAAEYWGPGVATSYGGSSGWEFFSPTQKYTPEAHIYNDQGTNPPATLQLINAQHYDGGLTPGFGSGGGMSMPNYQQKFMLWYKPQYDYQTIPFRGTIDPTPAAHNTNQVLINPTPWSFIFTRSGMVHSGVYTDYYTNGLENGTITLNPGMPYFDGEMAWNGMAQGLTIDGGSPFGDPVWWPPNGDPTFPPPPPPPPSGAQTNKILLPPKLTMIYYDSLNTNSTIKNNFWAGGSLQDYTSPVVHNIESSLWAVDANQNSPGALGAGQIKTNFFNEWVNSGLHVSLSYAQQPQRYQVNNIVSYLNFRIQNMQPITGDVYKVKLFKRPQAGIKSWEFMDEQIVERSELLVSESSNRPISSIGFFDNFETIDNNWYTGSGTYLTNNFPDIDGNGDPAPVSTSLAETDYIISWQGTPGGQVYSNESNPNANYPPFPTASISDTIVLGSLVCGDGSDLVSQSWDNITAATLPIEGNGLAYIPGGYESFNLPMNGTNLRPGKARSFYDVHTKTGIKLSSDTPYELSFILNAKQYAAFATGSDGAPTGHNNPCLHVYMTGSAFQSQHPNDPLYEHNFGKYVRSYYIHPDQAAGGGILSFGKQFANFSTEGPTTSDNKLRFIITGGSWVVSEISIKNKNQSGFTPADFGMQIKLGTEQYGEIMDFKLEFFNWYNQKANKDYYLYGLWVQGGNTYTNNPNDVQNGTTTVGGVGQTVGTGIQIFGVAGDVTNPGVPATTGGLNANALG